MGIYEEITTDPKYATAYAAKDVNTLQVLYNADTALGLVPVADLDVFLKNTLNNPDDQVPAYWTLKAFAAGTDQPQATLAGIVLDLFTSRLNNLDFALDMTISVLDKCEAAGVFSTAIKTALLALATKNRTATIQDIASVLYNPDGTEI